jgi:MFS family permease
MQFDRSLALACGGVAAMAAALGIGRFVYTPILLAMLGALGWSKSDAGLVASANFLGYFVGALLAGRPVRAVREFSRGIPDRRRGADCRRSARHPHIVDRGCP